MDIPFFKARYYPVKFFINTYQTETFSFTENGSAMDVTPYTWELFIKRYPGDRDTLKVISLTLGYGLSFPHYTTDQITAIFTAAQTNILEGEYYYELRRTDLLIPYLNGPANFYIGNVDSQ